MENTVLIDRNEALKRFRPISGNSHKGVQGHALIVGGSYGKMGSVCLSSKACLKAGAGLVTAYIPKCGYEIIQTALPEAMVITDDYTDHITAIGYKIKVDAVAIGMGLGQHSDTQHALYHFLKMTTLPMVIDADALNILSENKSWFEMLPNQAVLTPHKKELERLIGSWSSHDEMMEKVKAFSRDFDVVLVIKGAPTHVVYLDSVFENTTGNQALATAGSGDVLSGILAGLLSQGYAAVDAAVLGVYLHGLTANIAVPEIGHHSFIASDCIDNLGKAFLSLY
ncbi:MULTISPECIES: NAD(P)H-hydrate dehydratase [Flavobacterium]|uniref:NAD(P)H-hydrate dehydratase n=1 Tax=Flavobacterium TaxID=237 RepID=UPI001FCC3D34|nr:MULTISPECIES: NAD(P)H-hydrate dehydratase [Flavobacterium]UOK42021.1 NAD(P)H-hydrate dehydratase [Flavobacterium enshiense]